MGSRQRLRPQEGGADRVCLVHHRVSAVLVPGDGEGEAEREDQPDHAQERGLQHAEWLFQALREMAHAAPEEDADRRRAEYGHGEHERYLEGAELEEPHGRWTLPRCLELLDAASIGGGNLQLGSTHGGAGRRHPAGARRSGHRRRAAGADPHSGRSLARDLARGGRRRRWVLRRDPKSSVSLVPMAEEFALISRAAEAGAPVPEAPGLRARRGAIRLARAPDGARGGNLGSPAHPAQAGVLRGSWRPDRAAWPGPRPNPRDRPGEPRRRAPARRSGSRARPDLGMGTAAGRDRGAATGGRARSSVAQGECPGARRGPARAR